jgi:hypothetical protein
MEKFPTYVTGEGSKISDDDQECQANMRNAIVKARRELEAMAEDVYGSGPRVYTPPKRYIPDEACPIPEFLEESVKAIVERILTETGATPDA